MSSNIINIVPSEGWCKLIAPEKETLARKKTDDKNKPKNLNSIRNFIRNMANFPNNPFPNKVIQQAYSNAIGKTFTWSPIYQRFTDSGGNHDYDYHAMCWLKDNKWFK